MADPAMSVSPYWELTFDADGDPDGRRRDRLLAGIVEHDVRDLVVFAHGWNTDRSGATRLFSRFFAPIPGLAPTARLGFVGVVWPSMRFSDEPIPDFPRSAAADTGQRSGLDKDTRQALLEIFPGRTTVIDRIDRLLDGGPREEPELEEFGRLVRLLVEVEPTAPQAGFGADTLVDGVPQREPDMFRGPAAGVCEDFARALAPEGGPASFALPDLWDGAHELLRQATYYAMKRRAGTVGERGLGPAIGRLAAHKADLRVHLVGHSFGGRLVSFALRGLPQGVRAVKSVTLLQGAFSHYAFAARLPHDTSAGGALQGRQNRIDGPLVCCYSHFDSALGTMYPLASRLAGNAEGAAGPDVGRLLGAKWGAMGYDGVQAVPGTRAWKLADALLTTLPLSGCVNIDAAQVVRRGGAPAGAHSDIVHRELAQVVVAAGRIK
ncbi:serine-threonine protein kinase [Streptomyces sp. NPDC090106]|uniref:serine-threonine protein kinase n=1 Tax=Streptomyces sp. NPDC090106 TaxID=3365946 RepID=UPI0038074294